MGNADSATETLHQYGNQHRQCCNLITLAVRPINLQFVCHLILSNTRDFLPLYSFSLYSISTGRPSPARYDTRSTILANTVNAIRFLSLSVTTTVPICVPVLVLRVFSLTIL